MSNQGISAGQLLKQANQLKRAGKLDEAIALYRQAIKMNPNFAWAFYYLGDALVQQGKLDEAIVEYRQAIEINTNSAWFFYRLAEVLAKQGNLEPAVEYLEKAIEISPSFSKFYQPLDKVLNQSNREKPTLFNNSKKSYCTPLQVISLGQGWAGNTVNTLIFRHHAILTSRQHQFTAYYDDKEKLRLVRRDLETGSTIHHTISGEYQVRNAYNSISLGIDVNGYLHICYDRHGNSLHYRRSEEPITIDRWTKALPMSGKMGEKITCPTFLIHPLNKSLMFLYRHGSSSKGKAGLKTYNFTSKAWKDSPSPILSGYDQRPWTSNPYWNHPVFDRTGKLHLSYVWRTHPLGAEERVINC